MIFTIIGLIVGCAAVAYCFLASTIMFAGQMLLNGRLQLWDTIAGIIYLGLAIAVAVFLYTLCPITIGM